MKRRESGLVPPLPVEAPQHGVGQSTATLPRQGPDLVYRLGNGRVGGHPVHEKDLVGTEAKQVEEFGREARQALTKVKVQEVIETPSETYGPEAELMKEPTVPSLDPGDSLAERQVQPTAPGRGIQDICRGRTTFRDLCQGGGPFLTGPEVQSSIPVFGEDGTAISREGIRPAK